MVRHDGRRPGDRPARPWLVVRQRLAAGLIGVACLIGGATAALAVSGEDPSTVELFGIDTTCPTPVELDALHICFQPAGSSDGSCDLFDLAATETGDVLSTLLCPNRSILLNVDVVPETGPIDTGPILGSSTGYLRALAPAGASQPIHAVTHTFGSTVRTVEIAPGSGTTTACPADGGAQISLFAGASSSAFCSDLAAALPKLGVDASSVRFAIGYDFQTGVAGGSNFGGSNLMKVWACNGFNAVCRNGSPASLASLSGGGRVLEEVWLRAWLTETGLRIWR